MSNNLYNVSIVSLNHGFYLMDSYQTFKFEHMQRWM